MKIISLVPSITELLFDLGLKNQIIGRTKFCIHPKDEVHEIPQLGGTKNLHIDKIIQANADVIIANKEENLKSEVEHLQQHTEVMITDVENLEQNNQMILDIGKKTKTEEKAVKIVKEIQHEFFKLQNFTQHPKVLYLIWKNPYMSVGKSTFIDDMLQHSGFDNVCKHLERYPQITENDNLTPDFVFLSSEPYPFSPKHIPEVQNSFPNAKYILVDGEMFSWYGSRMRLAPKYFLNLRAQIL
ncbi:MAG: helical backbone metal receptor [Flavobacteriaceae bacterium]|nr:helical backbone metal receptor [Flavobacteriaceae bacterium]